MDRRKPTGEAVDREKNWGKTFNALVTLIKNLDKERRTLDDKIKYLNGVVYKMEMEQKVVLSKSEFLLAVKDRKLSFFKDRYECADSDLDDIRAFFEQLYQKSPDTNNNEASVKVSKREGSRKDTLENEVRKLQDQIDRCQSSKNLEISALLSEKNFIWNQYNTMEGNLKQQLKKKDLEVKQANDKISILMSRVEELQASNERWMAEHAKIELASEQKSQEISRLLKEIEDLKSRRESSSAPLLKVCTTRSAAPRKKAIGIGTVIDRSLIQVKKETSSLMTHTRSAHNSNGKGASTRQLHSKDPRNSSRGKSVECIQIRDDDNTPKLFSSSFKVPKLKTSSSPHVA